MSLKDYSLRPFTQGVLKDIPSQNMPAGGMTEGKGIVVRDGWVEKRKGFQRLNDCEFDEYILGILQHRDSGSNDYIFFGDRYHIYKIENNIARAWDDGYPWWDGGFQWDQEEGGVVMQLTPWGDFQVCPELSSSSSLSASSSSESSACIDVDYPLNGYDRQQGTDQCSRWSMVSFGNNIIASNYQDPILLIRGPAFDRYEALVCAGLYARRLGVFKNHILAMDTIDSINGAVPNRVWGSGLNDGLDWDYADPASECTYFDLSESPLPVTGGSGLRDSFVMYQPNMTHLLNYIGGTYIYSRQVVSREVGAIDGGLIASSKDIHFFLAEDGFYKYDGYSISPIGQGNNNYILDGLNRGQLTRSFSFVDINTREVHFIIPFDGSDIPNLDCIYDYANEIWTFDDVEATAGCPRVGLDYPLIARVGVTISMSSSSSQSSVSSSGSSSSSSSVSSVSSSSESLSISEAPVDANSYLQFVGVGLNDDDWPRQSYFETGEYVSFVEDGWDAPYIKTVAEITPVLKEIAGNLALYLGVRNTTDDDEDINWSLVDNFEDQHLIGPNIQGRYFSFRGIASDLDDYYKLSEIFGRVAIGGRR